MRKLLSAVILLFASVCAWGQGATVLFPPAVTQQGNFLPFAKITFCTTPATLDTLGNCTNTVTVYKDQALTQPYSSAILTDGIGYFPPNANTATSLWFTPAANLCFTLTTSSMISPATNPCTPFSVAVPPGGSPSFVNLSVKNLEGVRYADQFTGASVGAQIDAACADLAGAQGRVVIPSTMGAGNSLVGLLDNCEVMDLRGLNGPDQFGNEAQTYQHDNIFRRRWTTGNGTIQNLEVLHVHADAAAGGINQNNGPKTNYSGIMITGVNRTPGQHGGLDAIVNSYSNGDTVGILANAVGWGRNNAAGDEGVEVITGNAVQGANVPTGTVASVATNVINLSTQTNPTSLGEQRPLINTSRSVYSTGTVSGITGTPPTVTGSGTAWATQFGSGAKTNLFFALDADVTGGLKYVVPVRSITNDTTLILDFVQEGIDFNYPTANTGTYKIYQGSNVTAVNQSLAAVTVADGTQFTALDTVEQPIGYHQFLVGAHLGVNSTLPGWFGTVLNLFNAGSSSSKGGGRDVIEVSGNFFRAGIEFDNVIGDRTNAQGALIQADDTTNNDTVPLFSLPNNAGTFRRAYYDRSSDQWTWSGTGTGNTQNFSISGTASDPRWSSGLSLQANQAATVFYNNAAWNGMTIQTNTFPNNGVFPFQVNKSGVPFFYIKGTGGTAAEVAVNNGYVLEFYSGNQSGETAVINATTGAIKGSLYQSETNCSSSGGTCAAAPAGSVSIAAAATTVTVSTTAVTANSQILLTRDDSLGTKLSVTCNTQSSLVLGTPRVTARTAATSFVITIDVGPTTNPMCISYSIVN